MADQTNGPQLNDIFSSAPSEIQRAMLSTLDTAHKELVAGNLRTLIVIAVHKDDRVTMQGILAGSPESVVWQLQRAQFDLCTEHARQVYAAQHRAQYIMPAGQA